MDVESFPTETGITGKLGKRPQLLQQSPIHQPSDKSSALIYMCVCCAIHELLRNFKSLHLMQSSRFFKTPKKTTYDQFLKHGNFTTHCFQNSHPKGHYYNSLIRNRLNEKVQMGYSIISIHLFCILSAYLNNISAFIFIPCRHAEKIMTWNFSLLL